jgi:chromosomal replication initiation ATPase DnaA
MKSLKKLNDEDRVEFTFDTFISISSNIEAKRQAILFSEIQFDNKLLIISSSAGNGATHLAKAILNQVCLNNPSKDVAYLSFDLFALEKNDNTIVIDTLSKKSVLLIDSCNRFTENYVNLLNQIQDGTETYIIITCSNNAVVPVHGQRIYLELPTKVEMKIIIQNRLLRNARWLSNEVIDFLSEQKERNVGEILGMIEIIMARQIFYKKTLTLRCIRKFFEKF